MAAKKTYTITEAAKELKISRQAVHKAIRRQLLHAEVGTFTELVTRKGWVITKKELDKYSVSLSHQERGKKT